MVLNLYLFTPLYLPIRQAIHGGFRSVAIPELEIAPYYPTHHLAVKYRREESSTNFDIAVSGGNILSARMLHSRPKISYGDDDGYFSLLLLDMDFPRRAAGGSCVYWALLNICKSDRAAMKEVGGWVGDSIAIAIASYSSLT
jgi:hypothetical protein